MTTDRAPLDFDPMLLAVLSNRMASIVREMSNIVKKASRSTAITNARDFSCALLTYDHRLINVEDAMPVHVMAMDLSTRPVTALFDDIAEGDAFFSNSPYHGGTHHADMTLCVPVYLEGAPLFWTVARSHHADTGAHIPTTMDAYMRSVYEEGMHIPVVRFQERYRDRTDLIRWCRQNIRESHVWYGDYRAQVGACRTAETRLMELGQRYGAETLRGFIEAWMDYGRRRAQAAIRQMPAGTLVWSARHDPVPGIADEGVEVTAKVTIDPVAARITVDMRDNPDCVDGGINLSEACATGAARIGVFYNLDPSLPHNDGSAGCVEVLLRDGSIVGRPTFPVGTSNATMGVSDRVINAVMYAFTQLGQPHGLAEGGTEFGAGMGVMSGTDNRSGTPRPFVNMVFFGLSTGPGLAGHDGWLTYEGPGGGGVLALDQIEIDEMTYPLLVEERRISTDAIGMGTWNGAPAIQGRYRSLSGPVSLSYCSDGDVNAPRGVFGGLDGSHALNARLDPEGALHVLPGFYMGTIEQADTVVFRTVSGGGYGDPRQRDPDRVARDVDRRWISCDTARRVFGVELALAGNGLDHLVDHQATARLRSGGPT
jgi:N-methylhydantoinase B